MKIMRLSVGVLVCMMLLFGIVSVAMATGTSASGSCGDDLTWTFEQSTGVLTIIGTGKMDDYSENAGKLWPWHDYGSQIKQVVIAQGVESIGSEAFSDCTAMTEISIPDTVKTIGDYAFYKCSSLTEIVLPDSITQIGDTVWAYCSSLVRAVLPDSLTSMGSHSFIECYKLTSVNLPSGLTTIPMWTFFCCPITSIDIPETVTVIEKSAFRACRALTSITIPESVTCIEQSAFAECTSLNQVMFQGSAPEIYVTAFEEVVADVKYPAELFWDESDRSDYKGTLNWIPYESVENVRIEQDSVRVQLGYLASVALLPYTPVEMWEGVECESSNASVVDAYTEDGHTLKLRANGIGTATVVVKTHYGKTLTCQVTVVDSPIHQVTNGSGGEWEMGSSDNLAFATDAGKAIVNCVLVDGEYVDPASYTMQGERVSIIFPAEYLAKLSAGNHTLTVIFEDGTAEASFLVCTAQENINDTTTETLSPEPTETGQTSGVSEPAETTEYPESTEATVADNTDTTEPEGSELTTMEPGTEDIIQTQPKEPSAADSPADDADTENTQETTPWAIAITGTAAVLAGVGAGAFCIIKKRGISKLIKMFRKR